MFHATAMVRDYEATVDPLIRRFGCRVLHDNVVKDEGIGRRGGMTWVGDGSLEVGEPAGPRSPIQKFVDNFGGGMHSVALQVDDTEEEKARLARLGVRIINEPYSGMIWTNPADTAGILLEWFSHEEPTDPRWGGLVPDGVEPVVTVQRLAFVTAMVRDPVRDGARLAEIIGTSATILDDGDATGGACAVIAVGDCSLLLVALHGADADAARWGIAYDRPRLHGVGFLVDDLDVAVAALGEDGVNVHRRADRFVVLDPTALPLPVLLCDRLLPGDPRG